MSSTENWRSVLSKALPELTIEEQVPMSTLTTFRIGGPADLLVRPRADQMPALMNLCRREDIPCTVIGHGSNLLVADAGIRGLVVLIAEPMSACRIEGIQMEAEAGVLLSRMAAAATKEGLSGLEFAAGIPGSLGGAVMMNAGAYGGQMADVVTEVTVLNPAGEVVTIPGSEMDFGYRHSRLETEGGIVLSARMQLHPDDPGLIRERIEELRQKRVEKQPLDLPSAGSAFKRPEGHFAGKLIEEAGLRGFRIGDAMVSEKHCGFVVNVGSATAKDVRQLLSEVAERVYEHSGIRIEPEIRFVGAF